MSQPDDRDEFQSMRHQMGTDMSQDRELSEQARDVLVRSDRYNWSYQWTWLGIPIIQMPPDIIAVQEVIWSTRPQLIVETGVARGGSLVLSASILELLGDGRVIGIDTDIRPHNRHAIETHPLATRIELLEGSSTSPEIVEQVRHIADTADRTMVILDSDHQDEHVFAELSIYAPLVTPGQYLIVADTILEEIPIQQHRGGRAWGPGNNPATALRRFLATHEEFAIDSELTNKLLLTSNPGGYLRRRPYRQ